jgi:hypothetical protein
MIPASSLSSPTYGMPAAQDPRTAVMTVRSMAEKMNDLARRAMDLEDRYNDETDRDVMVQLGLYNGLADSCVFSCWTNYDDQEGVELLRQASGRVSDAWTYLRSGAPEIQRKLTTPSPEDLEFIHKRLQTRDRANSPNVTSEGAPDAEHRRDLLRHLKLPGRGLSLHTLLFKCTDLAQARRVLRAVGLQFTKVDEETLRVFDELIYVRRPPV